MKDGFVSPPEEARPERSHAHFVELRTRADQRRREVGTDAASLARMRDALDVANTRPEDVLETCYVELELQADELRTINSELERSRDRYFDLYDLAPVAHLTLDDAGRITDGNLTATQ